MNRSLELCLKLVTNLSTFRKKSSIQIWWFSVNFDIQYQPTSPRPQQRPIKYFNSVRNRVSVHPKSTASTASASASASASLLTSIAMCARIGQKWKNNKGYFFLITWVYLVVWNNVMLKKVANFVHVETSWGKISLIWSKKGKSWKLKLADCTAVKSCWYLWS